MNSLKRNKRILIDLDQIKARISIEDILSDEGIILKGGRCCCPLHNGDNPTSFSVKDGHFHCFSCGTSGDLVTYVQLRHNLDFREAIKYLASKAGLDEPEEPCKPEVKAITREIDFEKHWDKTIDDTILFLEEMLTALLKNLDIELRERRIGLSEYYQKQQILEYRLNCLDELAIYRNYEKNMRGKLDEKRRAN